MSQQATMVERLLVDRPVFHSGGAARWDCLPETLGMIERSVRRGARTLETGCGASTVVFAAAGSDHTAISPDPEEHRRVREYCDRIGVDASRVNLMVGFSDDLLPELCRDRIFDMAFIDGAHSFPYPEVDWHYVAKALKVGGLMLLDDVPIPAVAPLYRHMTLEPNWRLEGTPDNRAAAFTLTAPPAPEDWGGQPFNRLYPDYSFVPLRQRAALVAADRTTRLARTAAKRFPGLRDAWKRIVQPGER